MGTPGRQWPSFWGARRFTVSGIRAELAFRQRLGELNMTGTKYACGIAQCGACTVHVNGEPVRSCVLPVSEIAGKRVTTIEGLAKHGRLHPVQKAWIDIQVPQCGYCQAGQIMTVVSLLEKTPNPSDRDIDQALTNVCRCGTYPRVREAIHAVAKQGRGGKTARDSQDLFHYLAILRRGRRILARRLPPA